MKLIYDRDKIYAYLLYLHTYYVQKTNYTPLRVPSAYDFTYSSTSTGDMYYYTTASDTNNTYAMKGRTVKTKISTYQQYRQANPLPKEYTKDLRSRDLC